MNNLLKRVLIASAIFGLFVWFVWRNLGVIQNTYDTTTSHLTGYLILAILVMVASYWFLVKMFMGAFEMAGVKRNFRQMLILSLEALAINLIIPTAGVSMSVLFADDAKENGNTTTEAINGVFMTFMIDYSAISLLLALVLVFLASIHSLTATVYIPASIFFLLTFGVYLLSFLARISRDFVTSLMTGLAKIFVLPILKLFHKSTRIISHIEEFVGELADVNKVIVKKPVELLRLVLWALGAHFMRLATLYIIFVSLGIEPLYRIVLAGYAIGSLFVVVSPTPNGVGFVEGSMALVFNSLGIPIAAATTATILFRALEFWIPFGMGFFLLQRSRIKKISEETFA